VAVHDPLRRRDGPRRPGAHRPEVTFLVGENGSGKSTVVEAIPRPPGLTRVGGRARKYGNTGTKRRWAGHPAGPDPCGREDGWRLADPGVKGTSSGQRPRSGWLRWCRACPATGAKTSPSRATARGSASSSSRCPRAGLYLMDEPEAALSFISCLHLVALMHELGDSGAQVICAHPLPGSGCHPRCRHHRTRDHGFRHAEWPSWTW